MWTVQEKPLPEATLDQNINTEIQGHVEEIVHHASALCSVYKNVWDCYHAGCEPDPASLYTPPGKE